MNEKNPYMILGVKENATTSEIRKAFRELAKKYHPDTNPNNPKAEDIFREINGAYEILSDEVKRKEFNQAQYATKQATTSRSKGMNQGNKGQGMNFGMNFEEFMGGSMKKDSEKANKSQKDFTKTNSQFENFFGFKPK